MRIKLTNIIGVSLISLSVAFSAISNASAGYNTSVMESSSTTSYVMENTTSADGYTQMDNDNVGSELAPKHQESNDNESSELTSCTYNVDKINKYPVKATKYGSEEPVNEYERRRALESVHRTGHFRIFYTSRGPDALPMHKMKDYNGNGTPDFVEDIAIQLKAADTIFTEAFGLRPPLQSPRYKGVSYIDVHLLELPLHDESKSWGSVIASAKNYQRDIDNYNGLSGLTVLTTSLTMDLWHAIELDGRGRWYTVPIHELFHLYQYGYTMYRNKWFMEGMADWAAWLLSSGYEPNDYTAKYPYPDTEQAKETLYDLSYTAGKYWAMQASSSPFALNYFSIPLDIVYPYYTYTDLSRVVKDRYFYAPAYIKQVLQALESWNRFEEKNEDDKWIIGAWDWAYLRQIHPENNQHILRISEKYKDFDGYIKNPEFK